MEKISLFIFNFSMKKFIISNVIFVTFILSILICVNYFGDSAKIFDSSYEKKISKILLKNQNVTNILNYDERVLQKYLINSFKSSKDIIVLGSSRVMMINSNHFKNIPFFNSSVSGATIEDYIAIYQLYKNNNKLPKKIIIGLDPWIFNENNEQYRWKSIGEFYYSFFEKNATTSKIVKTNNIEQLLSLSYFQESFKNIFKLNTDPIATKHKLNMGNTKLTDGSITYGLEYRNASLSSVNFKAKKFITGNVSFLEGYSKISSKKVTEFDELCQEILNSGIELTFILTPYHPIVYEKLFIDYNIIVDVENFFVSYAKKNNIKYSGSFNPKLLKLDENNFYDGMHITSETRNDLMKLRSLE